MPITRSTRVPSGEPLTAEEFPARSYRTVKANKLKQMDLDIKEVVKSIVGAHKLSFYRILVNIVSRNLFAILTDMLEMAVEIAPYDTGELRSSGVVNAFVSPGRTSEVVADVDADPSGAFTVNQRLEKLPRITTRIESEISFFREGSVKDEEGKVIAADVALWAHEELLPYSPRPKKESLKGKWVATKKGIGNIPKSTGPKYLSRAVGQYQHRLRGLMEEAVPEAISEYNAKYGKRARRRKI